MYVAGKTGNVTQHNRGNERPDRFVVEQETEDRRTGGRFVSVSRVGSIVGYAFVHDGETLLYQGPRNAPEMTHTEVPTDVCEFAEWYFEEDLAGDTDDLREIRDSME